MKQQIVQEYDVTLDSKKRCTIRGKRRFDTYHVSVYKNGKIVMEPRYVARLDELSEKTLRMIDSSAKSLAKGISGKPIDFSSELKNHRGIIGVL